MLPYLHVFGFNLPLYSICIVVGLFAATGVVLWRCKPMGVPREDSFYCCLFAAVGLAVGGKVLSLLTLVPGIIRHWDSFWTWDNLVALTQGGFVFYGGLLGALGMVAFYTRHFHLSTLKMFDCLAVGVPLAHAFGRVGCFCAGCCYGMPVSWGVEFDAASAAPHGVALLPVQLIEAGCNLLLFGVLLALSFRRFTPGRVIGVYLLSYAVMRFVLEFFRYDAARGQLLWFSTSQWISLLMLPVAIWLLVRRRRSHETGTD